MSAEPLRVAVLYGSHRRHRQGIGVARFMVAQLADRGLEPVLVDSREADLPLLDLMAKEYDPGEAPGTMEAVGRTLASADGFIVVAAEYNHSVPPGLKNLLDHYQSEYLYKPSGIVTYSAGPFGGVRGLVNLRGILAELGTPAIPSAFPVSAVGRSFDRDGTVRDEAYLERVGRFLDEFEWYALALRRARREDVQEDAEPVQQSLCRGEKTEIDDESAHRLPE